MEVSKTSVSTSISSSIELFDSSFKVVVVLIVPLEISSTISVSKSSLSKLGNNKKAPAEMLNIIINRMYCLFNFITKSQL